MKKATFAVLLIAEAALAAPGGRVAGSKHDLSSTGPGDYRAASEKSPCVFCHATHGRASGRSNRPETAASHRPYQSSTMKGHAARPTGASRICLSCHDGTIAVGRTRKREIDMVGGNRPIAEGRRSNLGTDLRGTHPVSIHPAPGDGTSRPAPGDAVRLDDTGALQCTSCHDPHAEWGDPVVGKFLVKPSGGSALCASCHASPAVKGGSSHFSSTASITDATGRLTTVAEAGCAACHASHGADTAGQLVRRGRADDDGCLACHSGKVAQFDIGSQLSKPWAHATASSVRVHDAGERPDGRGRARLPEPSPGAPRHVTCVDCHDPHTAVPATSASALLGGPLSGTWGIGLDGSAVEPARFEYEICLKCHGDSANKPQASGTTIASQVRRATADVNLRRVFEPTAPSYHPVAAPGRNADVPGLVAPLGAASMIRCTDCHASDDGAEGGGPRGPHGSSFAFLLERQYLTRDGTAESPAAYALCYKCHDREILLSDRSHFTLKAPPPGGESPALHQRHARHATPCSACHDAHGVSADAGNEQENAHLVSFDLSIVQPGADRTVRYLSSGKATGSCNLTCHGEAHTAATHRY